MTAQMNDFKKAIQAYNTGLKEFENGDIEKAISSFKQSIQFDASDPDVYNNLGVAYIRLNKIQNAIDAFVTSIELDPIFARSFNNLGVALFKQDFIDQARDQFEKAIECDDYYTASFLNLSFIYKLKGMASLSIDMYMNALEISSKSRKNNKEMLGVSFLETDTKSFNQIFNVTDYDLLISDKWERTEITVEDILNTYKILHEGTEDSSESFFNLGNELYKKAQYAKAIEYFEKAIDLDENYYPAYYNLALAYEMNGDNEEAANYYKKAVKIQPTLAAYLSLAIMLFRLGNYSQTMYNIEKAKGLAGNDSEKLCNIGHALSKIGKLSEANEFYNKAIEVDPMYTIAYYNLGVIHTKLGELDQAIESYMKVIEIEPDNAPALNNIGVAYERLGHLEKAADYYQKALDVDTKYSIAYENLFEILKRND